MSSSLSFALTIIFVYALEQSAANAINNNAAKSNCQPVNCFIDPCRFASCPANPKANCTVDYCSGSCKAIFVDANNVPVTCVESTTQRPVRRTTKPIRTLPTRPTTKPIRTVPTRPTTTTTTAPSNGCPAVEGGTFGICLEECTEGSVCDNGRLCCSNGCGHTCSGPVQQPVSVKPPKSSDGCPAVEDGIFGICLEECRAGTVCSNGRLCCSNGCGHTCSGPQKSPPSLGACPAVQRGMMGICVEMCRAGTVCNNGRLCCSNGCGHTCSGSVVGQPGGSSSDSDLASIQ